MGTDKYKALLSAIETGSLSAAAAELMEFTRKDLIHAFE